MNELSTSMERYNKAYERWTDEVVHNRSISWEESLPIDTSDSRMPGRLTTAGLVSSEPNIEYEEGWPYAIRQKSETYIADPMVALEMAKIEDPHRRKLFGILGSKALVHRGEVKAEEYLVQELLKRERNKPQSDALRELLELKADKFGKNVGYHGYLTEEYDRDPSGEFGYMVSELKELEIVLSEDLRIKWRGKIGESEFLEHIDDRERLAVVRPNIIKDDPSYLVTINGQDYDMRGLDRTLLNRINELLRQYEFQPTSES